jgi:N-acetylmuramoyl-L-alanine amidase
MVAKGGRRRKRKNTARKFLQSKTILILALLLIVVIFLPLLLKGLQSLKSKSEIEEPELNVELLTISPYNRPGIALEKVNGIVIHYTANPGASAISNRNYFEGLSDGKGTKASAHFIVGLEGEIVQCIPTAEIAYASNDRNYDTLAIECCHPDESGKFNDATYQSVVNLTAWLCQKFNLTSEDVIRHYDVTGKNCPKYYVENEEAWTQLKKDVQKKLDGT